VTPSRKRRIAVVTGTRSDYGILYWLLREIQQRPTLELQLLVTGMHLSPEFGLTYRQIEAEGFPIQEKIEILLSSDTPVSVSTSIALGIIGFAKALERNRPDILVLMGDRFESLAAGIAAMVGRIPIAHISGGQSTEGAIDESIRHALTKMSHYHFPATVACGERIVQMGEAKDHVFVFGAPSLDGIRQMSFMSKEELEREIGLDPGRPTLLVVYHPVTLERETAGWQMDELLAALSLFDYQMVFLMPNADTGGRVIFEKIRTFVAGNSRAKAFITLARPIYLNLLRSVRALVGNSSSGLIEAPAFELPAVNIGDRQRGRTRARNVIDCGYDSDSIAGAIRRALDPTFRDSLRGIASPYGDGNACKHIVDVLEEVELGEVILKKGFHSCDGTTQGAS
jgi:UDP-hydrolysing UDP-N-acetyl-D-glucosamine 2-epimerase